MRCGRRQPPALTKRESKVVRNMLIAIFLVILLFVASAYVERQMRKPYILTPLQTMQTAQTATSLATQATTTIIERTATERLLIHCEGKLEAERQYKGALTYLSVFSRVYSDFFRATTKKGRVTLTLIYSGPAPRIFRVEEIHVKVKDLYTPSFEGTWNAETDREITFKSSIDLVPGIDYQITWVKGILDTTPDYNTYRETISFVVEIVEIVE
jgi:hypothetical protein